MTQTTSDTLAWKQYAAYSQADASFINGAALLRDMGMPSSLILRELGAEELGEVSPENVPPRWRGRLDEPRRSGCPYCSNTGTHVNARGGVECSGCGSPR